MKTKTSTVIISNVTAQDDGNYTCIGKSGNESGKKNAHLSVAFKGRLASITPGPIEVTVSKNDNVKISCIFEGNVSRFLL